ncbi:hypothetical protein LCGC14_0605580 [marine sediment metagenome]|uniref:Baseplate hub protein gp44-like N-terminal domain-containing protein n=2 Tax=root TaxID=1 RepID=A0A9C9TJ09_9HYPH|nr:hypothetical protein [Aurantimonas coralicida]
MTLPSHEINVIAARQRIPGWKEYTISTDLLQPADEFSMSVQFTRAAWDLLPPDQIVSVFVDSTKILTGFVDERFKTSDPGGGTGIELRGRDKSGRLVDESAPLFRFGGLKIKELAEKIVGIGVDADPLFERVTLVNTRNRSLLRDVRARQARTVREPVNPAAQAFRFAANIPRFAVGLRAAPARTVAVPPIIDPGIFQGRAAPKKVTPGSSRWAVLEKFIREARLIAWSTGDGRELFVGLPNYEQEAQYYFFEAATDSDNRDQTNAKITVRHTVADRYSKITAVGAARGTRSNYGSNVTKNRGVVLDNPDDPDGVGFSFLRRKALVITDDSIKNPRDALERAEREMLERDANALEVIVDVPGHSQVYAGETPTVYAVDTIARVEDEDTGLLGDMYVTSVEFTRSRGGGTRSTLRLVPRGTLLQT